MELAPEGATPQYHEDPQGRLAKEPKYSETWRLEHVFRAITEMYKEDDGLIITARRAAVTLLRIYLLARGCDILTMLAKTKPLQGGTALEVQIRRKMKRHFRPEVVHAVANPAL